MSEKILKNFKTSLFKLLEKEKTSILSKIIKYIRNPSKIFPRLIISGLKKISVEMNWDKRVQQMGNSAVFANNISKKEQEKITKIHQEILSKVLKNKLKKKTKVLDFGCGYGRFSDFFIKNFNSNYVGVENSKLFLKNSKNSKKKNFLSFVDFKKNKKYNNYFDLCFIFAVLGGLKKEKAKKIVKILKNKIKPNGKICFVDIVSEKEKEGSWNFRTENFYEILFYEFKTLNKYYFLEDGQKKMIYYGEKIK